MRTIVDLPEELVAQLDALRQKKRLSRAELIRRAVRLYLKQAGQPDPKQGDKAFGLWRTRQTDGLAYEDAIRQEWETP